MGLGTWNVRNLYRAGSLRTAATEIGRYKLGTLRAGDCISFYGKEMNVASSCECGNELSGSIKCGEFLDYLRSG